MAHESNIGGLIFFNENQSAGGFVRIGDVECKVRGTFDPQGNVEVTGGNGEFHLKYHKVEQGDPRGPVGRGQLQFRDEVMSVSVFRITRDGSTYHGLADSQVPARVAAPF